MKITLAILAGLIFLGCQNPEVPECIPSDSGVKIEDSGLNPNQWDFLGKCTYLFAKDDHGVEVRIFDCSASELCLPFENYGFFCGSQN